MNKPEDKRGGGPRAIAASVDRITRPTLARRGFAEASVIADWPAIVGAALAEQVCPLRIVYPRGQRGDGTLHVRVASGALATQLQHLHPLVLERINGHFGYRAVARLAVTQGPLPPRPQRVPPPAPALSAEGARDLEARLTGVEDPELRAALAGLGRFVLARKD